MLKSELINGILVCSFEQTNKLNSVNSEKVKKELTGHFNEPGKKLVIDLGNISFIDSSGFAILLSLMKGAKTNSGKLCLCNLTPNVMKLFSILLLDKVFNICPGRDECIAGIT